jgi:hypothetical protein
MWSGVGIGVSAISHRSPAISDDPTWQSEVSDRSDMEGSNSDEDVSKKAYVRSLRSGRHCLQLAESRSGSPNGMTTAQKQPHSIVTTQRRT